MVSLSIGIYIMYICLMSCVFGKLYSNIHSWTIYDYDNYIYLYIWMMKKVLSFIKETNIYENLA